MKLSATQVAKAKPKEKPYKLSDGKGLFLLVKPNGSRYWRLRYFQNGKAKGPIALGVYPEVSLADARERQFEVRQDLANGLDPALKRKREKQQSKQADSFEAVAREWHEKNSAKWVESHSSRNMRRLEKHVFPYLGSTRLNEIEAPELLAVLRRIESKGTIETARRVRSLCGQIFRYGVATGVATRDVAADLRDALASTEKKHLPAITEPKLVAALLRSIDAYSGMPVTLAALKIAPLVFVRPGELRQAKWEEIDLDNALWTIPASKMKTKVDHIVPLSIQVVEVLTQLYPLTKRSEYVFPSARSAKRPMSNNAINAALRGMGYDKETMTGHGFRAMARTILDEELKFRPDYIEHQLAHAVKDPNGRAYNRTQFLHERREMMQAWADYLDALKRTDKVTAIGSQHSA